VLRGVGPSPRALCTEDSRTQGPFEIRAQWNRRSQDLGANVARALGEALEVRACDRLVEDRPLDGAEQEVLAKLAIRILIVDAGERGVDVMAADMAAADTEHESSFIRPISIYCPLEVNGGLCRDGRDRGHDRVHAPQDLTALAYELNHRCQIVSLSTLRKPTRPEIDERVCQTWP
jgi:hypothetical protein